MSQRVQIYRGAGNNGLHVSAYRETRTAGTVIIGQSAAGRKISIIRTQESKQRASYSNRFCEGNEYFIEANAILGSFQIHI